MFTATIVLLAAFYEQSADSFSLSSRNQQFIKQCTKVGSTPASNRFTTQISAAAIPVAGAASSIFDKIGLNCITDFFRGKVVTNKFVALGTIVVASLFALLRAILWKPSRTYDRDANSVGREYDAWTTEGILEEYWGEHIHLGYYSPEELKAGYKKKNFIEAKYDFVDQMMAFGKASSLAQPMSVLDVGCGIGGTNQTDLFYFFTKIFDQLLQ